MRNTRSNPDPNSPAVIENPNLIPKIIRKQKQKEDPIAASPEIVQPSCVPTPVKVLFRSTPTSPCSSSTSPNTVSTPPFTTHTTASTPIILVTPVVPLIPVNMANRYAPLQLPTNPEAMPQDYQTKITYFDGTSACTALQHTKKMQDYFESYEIDDDSVRMNIFVQILTSDVRTWFRVLPAHSIADP